MLRIAIGLGLVAGAAYLGRRTSSRLSAPPRTFVERALDDVGAFALTQFPREEIRAGEDPRMTRLDFRMQCDLLTFAWGWSSLAMPRGGPTRF